jgi:hypothetical protein
MYLFGEEEDVCMYVRIYYLRVRVCACACVCVRARDVGPGRAEMNIVCGRSITPFIDSSSGWFSIKSKWLPWVTGSSMNGLTARENR